jgi:tRNA threonylcarbamoyladenosine biosynthesis protein TsaE
MPMRGELPVRRHPSHRLEDNLAGALVLADVAHLFRERPEERKRRGADRLAVPGLGPPQLDDEHAVVVNLSLHDLERESRTCPTDVWKQVRLGLLRHPERLCHRVEQHLGVREQAGRVSDSFATFVDVPAAAHGGHTIGVELESATPEQTEEVGADIAAVLRSGDLVTVSGELGTGKTTLVRGACRALGVDGPITSPTFTVGHRYRGRVDVSHLDLYRFSGVSPAEWGDLEPYFDDAVCFVEWPEAGEGVLPPARFAVTLEHAGDGRRRIEVDEC